MLLKDEMREDVEMALDQKDLKVTQQKKQQDRRNLIGSITKEAISRNSEALKKLAKN